VALTTHHLLEPRLHLHKNIPLPSLCASVAHYRANLTLPRYGQEDNIKLYFNVITYEGVIFFSTGS